MAAPLRLSIEITGSASALKPATDAARTQVQSVGAAARATSADARAMETSFGAAGRSIAAQASAIRSLADATPAVRATEVHRASLNALRAEYDPLFAVSTRYAAELDRLKSTYAAGAIAIETYAARERELRMAFEATRAALSGRDAAMKTAADTMVARQTITPDRGADIAAYGAQLDALRSKYNPLFAAETAHEKELASIARAQRVGAITSDEAAAAVARQTTAHNHHVAALKRAETGHGEHAGAMKLSSLQAQQLSYQLNDVAVSLASGMNPLTVLIQQGSQITPVFGGATGTLHALVSAITPLRLALAVVGGLTAVSAKSLMDYSNSMREADVAARGMGRAAGTSAGDIAMIARQYAAAGDVSVDQARSMAVAFTRTGRIGAEQFGDLITIAKDFAATIETDVESGTRRLAEIFADPARGAETLAQTFGLIDESAARAIQRLADVGNVAGAQAEMLGALDGRLVKYGDSVAWYIKLWERLDGARTGGGSLGAALADRTQQEKLAALQEQYRSVMEASEGGLKEVAIPGMRTSIRPWLDQTKAEIDRLRADVERERQTAAEHAAHARRDRAGSLAVAVADRAPANDDIGRRRGIERDLVKLQAGEDASNISAEERERIARATDAASRALATWIAQAERARALDEIELKLMASRDPLERAMLEAERARVQARGQVMTTTDAAAEADRAYARSIGEVLAAALGSTRETIADAAARARVNALVESGAISLADANRELQIEAQTRQLIAGAASAEGSEKAKLLATAAGLRQAIIAQDTAQHQASALQTIQDGRDRIENLRLELSLVGQLEDLRRRSLAMHQAEQGIRRQGLDATSTEAAQIRANAAREAELQGSLDARRRAVQLDMGRKVDRIDLAASATRDPVDRARLAAERARIEALSDGRNETEAAAEADRAYARSIGEVVAAALGSTREMIADAAARARVNALVASGAISMADANRELQIEAQTRQLIAAAASAEGSEKAKLLATAAGLRQAIIAQDAAQRRASGLSELQSGADRLDMLRGELALIGASEPVRARYLAQLEAEQRIRSMGLGGTDIADKLRAQALATADASTQLDRMQAAWGEIQSTGGSAIDTLVEGLRQGKLDATSLFDDLQKEFFKLALANPMKNALFGSSLPTLSDVGGLMGNIIGNKGADVSKVPGLSGVGSMTVTAGTVMINGGIGGLGLNGGSGDGLAGMVLPKARPTGGSGTLDSGALSVLKNIDQTGRASSVNGLNPEFGSRLAALVKDAQARFGVDAISLNSGYRTIAHQEQLWQGALAKYGSPDAARKWVAPPGSSQHNFGRAADLGYSGNGVESWMHGNASKYGLTYRMGYEGWHIEPAKGTLGAASAASAVAPGVQQLSGQAASASAALQSVASSGQQAGGALGSIAQTVSSSSTSITKAAGGMGAAAGDLEASAQQTAKSATGAFETLFGALGGGMDKMLGTKASGAATDAAGAPMVLGGGSGGTSTAALGPLGSIGAMFKGIFSVFGSLFSGIMGLFSGMGGFFGLADGGLIKGPGTSTSDSILGTFAPGTFIVNAGASKEHKGLLQAMLSGAVNDNGVPVWVSAGEMAIPPAIAARNAGLLAAINSGKVARRALGGPVSAVATPAVSVGVSPYQAASARAASAGVAGGPTIHLNQAFDFRNASPETEARMRSYMEEQRPAIVNEAVAAVAAAHHSRSGFMR